MRLRRNRQECHAVEPGVQEGGVHVSSAYPRSKKQLEKAFPLFLNSF